MKQTIVILISFLFVSCSSSFLEKDYMLNKQQEATVGSSIISWSIGKEDNGDKTGMKKELIYGGVSQNVLQFTYREYVIESEGTYARPAFYQDLKYDVPSDNIITYKDVVFKIHSFSGQKIIYSVLKEPNEVKNYHHSSGLGRLGLVVITTLLSTGILVWLLSRS